MGRGRQKAKQTKVARQLKYFSPDTDYDALQRELASNGRDRDIDPFASGSSADEDVDEREGDDDEYVDWSSPRDRR